MSAKHCLIAAAALVAATALTTQAFAAKKPTVSGCTEWVAPFCVGIKAKGKTYVLHGANPWLPTGIGAAVWGKVEGVSVCGGTPVQVATWKQTKRVCK
jgi:hypothetical protein